MRLIIKTTNIELTPAISDYLEKKVNMLDKVVDKDDTTALCNAEVGKPSAHHQSGDVFYAEFNVVASGKSFRATAQESTLYAAIDKAKDDVLREIRRTKKKDHDLLRRGGARLKEITQTLSVRGARLKGFIERARKRKK
jgi:ribosomal subunit interface protein